MKRQDNWGVGGSIFLTIVFAGMAIFTYQTDTSGNPLALIPGIGIFVGIVMAIKAANKAADESAKKNNKRSSLNPSSMIAVTEMEILKYISTQQIKRLQSVLLLQLVPAKK